MYCQVIVLSFALIELFCTSSEFSKLLLLVVEHVQHQIAPRENPDPPWTWDEADFCSRYHCYGTGMYGVLGMGDPG